MRVIITGGNGFIGSELVRKFYKNGDKVISIIRNKNEDISKIEKYSQIIFCEIENLDEIFEKLKIEEETIFYHLAWAGVNGIDKANYNIQILNIQMACNAAVFAKKLGVKRFLVAGTVAENAIYSYSNLDKLSGGLMYSTAKASTHLFIENLCKNICLSFVWLQFSNIYGPSNKTGNLVSYTLKQLTQNKKATFGPANQPYDFILVDDLIEAVYRFGLINELKSTQYFIGSGNSRLLCEYLTIIGRIFGKEELIDIGIRKDDGIKYEKDMFSTVKTVGEIGDYISKSFEEGIKYTIENY